MAPANRGYFRPGVNVTRAQFAKIVSVADCQRLPLLCFSAQTPPPGYSDVPADAWFYPYLATGKQHGYFRGADTGTNNQFLPGEPVTRREAATWMWNHMRLRLALP